MATVTSLCVTYSPNAEVCMEAGRIAANGSIVAPVSGAKFSSAVASGGVYALTFTNPYAEFLTAQITYEGLTTTALPEPEVSWNPANLTLTITMVASGGGPGANTAFNFVVIFRDNLSA